MKKWLLKIWNRIMIKYAGKQLSKLKRDFKEIYFQYSCYKEWYNVLLLMWLTQNNFKSVIINETNEEMILEVTLDDAKETIVQLPVTQHKDIFKNIMNLSYKKGDVIPDMCIKKLTKFALSGVLERYKE